MSAEFGVDSRLRFKRWRLAGIVAITVLGFLLHYLYSLTGSSRIIGFFVPVNESVWEHLKMGYWAVVLFSIVEYSQIKYAANNYWLAKFAGVISLELTIIIIFYGYYFIIGKDIILIDISSYIIGAIICQYLSNFLLRMKPISKSFNLINAVAFIALGALFGITTYHPPHIDLFKDSNTNTFGINEER